MYKYDQYDQAMVDARVEEFRDQARRSIDRALESAGVDAALEAVRSITVQGQPARRATRARSGRFRAGRGP